jgi:hypothetical protein
VVRDVDIRRCNDKAYNYYKYLNNSLLRAPREYVLHGLVLGLDWAPLWPHPISMHLVATPNPVSCCLLQRFKFHPNVFYYLGGFSLMYKQNITTTLHNTWHTCMYITLVLLFILFFLHFFHFLGQAGCPPLAPSVAVKIFLNAGPKQTSGIMKSYFTGFCRTLKI